MSFRIDPVLWHELGCHARLTDASRCLAFVELLRAYMDDIRSGRRIASQSWRGILIFSERVVRLHVSGSSPPILKRLQLTDGSQDAFWRRLRDRVRAREHDR